MSVEEDIEDFKEFWNLEYKSMSCFFFDLVFGFVWFELGWCDK